MKIKFLKSVSLALVLVALIVSVVQADTTWAFKFPTDVDNTGASALTYYPVNLGYGTANLVASGKMAASGLDTNMQIASESIPYMLADDKVLACIPSLPSKGVNEVDLYTGYTPNQTSTQIVLGSGGYITTADDAALELGNNFSTEFQGYIDTTKTGDNYLINKDLAFSVIQNETNLGAYIWNTASNYSGSFIQTSGLVGTRCGSRFNSFSGLITSAQLYILGSVNSTGTTYMRVRKVSDDSLIGTLGVIDAISWSAANLYTPTFNSTPVLVPESMDIRVTLEGGSGYSVRYDTNGAWSGNIGTYYDGSWHDIANAYSVQIVYTSMKKSVNSVITSGEHAINVSADATNLILSIDAVQADSTALSGASVNNNANAWVFKPINYWNYYSQTVGGVEKLKYQPNAIILGTAMPDRVNSYNGVITWGSNSNITLTYGEPVSYQSTSSASGSSGLGYSNPNATLPSTWFAFGENASQLPFYDSFNNVSQQTGQPVQTMYFIGLLGVALGLFIILVTMARSVMVGCAGFLIVLFVGSSMTIVPMWIPFVCLLVMVGILFLYRQLAY